MLRVSKHEISQITIDKKNYPMRLIESVRFSRSHKGFIQKFIELCKILKCIYIMGYCNFNHEDMKGRNIYDYLKDYLKIPEASFIFCEIFKSNVKNNSSQKSKFVYNVISKRCENLLYNDEESFHTISDIFELMNKFNSEICEEKIYTIMCETLKKFMILNELGFEHRMITEDCILYNGFNVKISEYDQVYFIGCKENRNFDQIMEIFRSKLLRMDILPNERLFRTRNFREALTFFGKNISEKTIREAFYENYKDEFIDEVECVKKSENVNENFALNVYGDEGFKIRVLYEDIEVEKIPDFLNFFPFQEMLEIEKINNLFEFKIDERDKFSKIFHYLK